MMIRGFQPAQLRVQLTIARAVVGVALCVMMVSCGLRVPSVRAIATNPSPLEVFYYDWSRLRSLRVWNPCLHLRG